MQNNRLLLSCESMISALPVTFCWVLVLPSHVDFNPRRNLQRGAWIFVHTKNDWPEERIRGDGQTTLWRSREQLFERCDELSLWHNLLDRAMKTDVDKNPRPKEVLLKLAALTPCRLQNALPLAAQLTSATSRWFDSAKSFTSMFQTGLIFLQW